jgi:hypothetical protein
MIPSS